MRRLFLILVLLLLPAPSFGQDAATYEALTIDSTSGGVAIGASTLRPSGRPVRTFCVGTLETAQVRYRVDGGAPTTTVGSPLNPTDVLVIQGVDLNLFRAIRTGSTSGVLQLFCYQ